MGSFRKLWHRVAVAGSALIAALLIGLGFVFAGSGSAAAETTVPSSTDSSAVLVSHWPFDDSPGAIIAFNIVNPSLSGIIGGLVAQSTDVAPLLSANPYAIETDGSSGYVEIPDDNAIDFDTNQDFTIAFWTKPTGSQNPTNSNADNAILEKWSDGSDPYPYVVRYMNQLAGADAGKISVVRYDSNVGTGIMSTVTIDDGSYHHVAMVRGGGSSGTLSLYIDGVLQDSIPDVVSQTTTNSSPLFVGKRGNDINYYKGLVDDLRIYNGALTPHEVALLDAGCASISTTVASEAALNEAITCFNNVSVPGNYTITLSADINLAASTTIINNGTAGVELTIEGDGHTVDGQDIGGVRPFEIGSSATVTLANLTITGGKQSTCFSGGGIRNAGNLTILSSVISGNSSPCDGGGLHNQSGTVTIQDSTFSGNTAGGASFIATGGAINNFGTMTISGSTISGNTAKNRGGGISNRDTMTISNSTISDNSAGSAGGGIENSNISTLLTLTNSTISDNSAPSAGGLLNRTTINLNNSLIANNAGGDCANDGGTTNAQHTLVGDGLGCVNGTNSNNQTGDPLLGPLQDNGGPTLTHALLAGSPAIGAGSNALALDADGSTPLASDQRGAGFPRILISTVDQGAYEWSCPTFPTTVANQAELTANIGCYNAITTPGTYTMTLSGDILLSASTPAIQNTTGGVSLVIDGDGHTVDGQGISGVRPFEIAAGTTMTLQHMTISGGNMGNGDLDAGGAIRSSGNLTVLNSTLANNSSGRPGGAINITGSNSTLRISGSTLSGNSAETGGAISNTGTASISNSTFSNNSATLEGGAILNTNPMTIYNSTFSGNSAGGNGGGGILNFGAALTIANSIIANSTSGGDCVDFGGSLNISYTLIEDGSCSISNGVNGNKTGDPTLDSLQDNGGPTQTMALLAGSPAIDAADDATCAAAPVNNLDQRGVVRPFGTHCDMGAYEVETATQPGPDFVVNTGADSDDGICDLLGQGVGNQDCTLREAINAANVDAGASVITFAGDYAISLTSSLPALTTAMTIDGENTTTSIDGGDAYQLFTINAAVDVTVQNLDLLNGLGLPDPAGGGALYNNGGTVALANCSVSSSSSERGGGIYNRAGTLTVKACTIEGNQTTSAGGGGILNEATLTVGDSLFQNNTTGSGGISGGGIFNGSGAMLTADNSTFQNNTASGSGGAVASSGPSTVTNSRFIGNSASSNIIGGGAILNFGTSSMDIANSTFSGNQATNDGGSINNGVNNTLTVTNSTFYDNTAAVDGGGILNAGNTTVVNSTFSANAGGGIANTGTISLKNTILANSTAGVDCFNTGSMSADVNNLIENNSGCGTPLVTADPLLGPLQDNGGSTQTMALLAGSPAIDAGDNITCAAAPVTNLDQRGITRPKNSTCDIGAYEAGTLVCGVSAGGSYTFSEQSGVVIEVVNASDLTCLYVEEVPGNHPQATGAEDGDQLKTGTYWRIGGLQEAGGTPANSFTANLTLPQADLDNPQACKYTPGVGNGWDCAVDSSTTSTVTRNGLTSFSDWTVGTLVPTAVSLQLFTAHPRAIGGWAGLLALVGLLAAISVRFLWRGASRAL